MKLSDEVFDFFLKKGINQCFAVSGGAAAHLFDSIGKSNFNVIHMHHEQACTMAADGYARLAKKPAIVLLTNGPGVSNALTGVLGAFQDSIPMIVISGQVSTHQMLQNGGGATRQIGVQEVETEPLVKSIVKYFVSLNKASELPKAVNKAWEMATTGRPGPVWIEIPLNIQSAEVERIAQYNQIEERSVKNPSWNAMYEQVQKTLEESTKPIIVIGGGIHTSNSEKEIKRFVKRLGVPVVSTWGANDIFDFNDDSYIGNFGILGNRIPNYAVQRADLLLILGSRMSIPNSGYQTELFSPNSKKIMVNIDELEMQKSTINIDLQINCDLQQWLSDYPFNDEPGPDKITKWHKSLIELKTQYGISKEICINDDEGIDSYKIIEELSRLIAPDATLVTDMGTSFTCTMQAFMNKQNTRLFTSSGTSSMGFGLPGAIGAYFGNKERPIYLIAGDGGFQMNIQELQTVKFHNIPIRIIVLNSNGYLAISIMQQNSFNGNYVGSNPESGIDAPVFFKIAEAYGIASSKVSSLESFKQQLEDLHPMDTPILIEVSIPSKQIMRPRSQSLRREDGSFYSNGIEVMWPDLTASEVEDIESRIM